MSHQKSSEDYLEAILMIQKKSGSCRSVDVASHMGFSKPSVSIAMAKLEASGHIEKRADGQIFLTVLGRRVAEKTLEKHRFLLELFQKIGVSDKTAEEDACNLEHSLSNESYQKLREWVEKAQRMLDLAEKQ